MGHIIASKPVRVLGTVGNRYVPEVGLISSIMLAANLGTIMRIFLDDERNPKIEEFDIILRSFISFKFFIDSLNKQIDYISFDHDLGLGHSGYACAKYLVEEDIRRNLLSKEFAFNVHSANPIGKKNIEEYLKNYLRIARN